MTRPARSAGLDLIRLATPTSDERRLPVIVEHASGFLYYVAIAGITGTRSADSAAVAAAVARLRRFTPLPVAVGFGIGTAAQAAEVGRIADGVIIGSRLVRAAGEAGSPAEAAAAVADFLSEARVALAG